MIESCWWWPMLLLQRIDFLMTSVFSLSWKWWNMAGKSPRTPTQTSNNILFFFLMLKPSFIHIGKILIQWIPIGVGWRWIVWLFPNKRWVSNWKSCKLTDRNLLRLDLSRSTFCFFKDEWRKALLFREQWIQFLVPTLIMDSNALKRASIWSIFLIQSCDDGSRLASSQTLAFRCWREFLKIGSDPKCRNQISLTKFLFQSKELQNTNLWIQIYSHSVTFCLLLSPSGTFCHH